MRRFALLGLFLVFAVSCCKAQEDLTNILKYIKHAMLFNYETPQEKVYLHFDNTAYFKGETMFFKAYVVRGTSQPQARDCSYVPSSISRVLYVELVNPSGDVVERRKLQVTNGMAEGDIRLDSIFGTGFYEVRAFTRYMMNWGGTGVFSRVFPIYKKPAKEGDYANPKIDELSYTHRLPNGREKEEEMLEGTKQSKSRGYSLSFYPEGGHLVRGLQSRVAFSVTDRNGKHAAVRGLLIDKDGEMLTYAQSERDGRGTFDVVPDGQAPALSSAERELTFVVTDEDGKRHEFALPQPLEEGCVMRLEQQEQPSDILRFIIQASPGMQGRLLGYMLTNSGNVIFADTLQAQPAMELQFDRNKMYAGVNQLTLFDSNGHIQAERLFFICPEPSDADSIHVVSATQALKPCGKVRLNITAQPNAELSFSAMDVASLTNGKVGNSRTWMLLGSDVRGYIENPDYYFESDDAEHRRAADLLMMVQGWRRYDWRLQTGVMPFSELSGRERLHPIEDKLYLYGQLHPDQFKWRKKHPTAGVDLTAFLYNSKGEHMQGNTTTDSLGFYAFDLPDVSGEWNLQIQTKYNDKNAAYVVAIDRHFSPASRMLSPYETEMIPLPQTLLKPVEGLGEDEEAWDGKLKLSGSGKNASYVLPNVKVVGRYFTDNSHLPWYDERTGARKSTVYYDMDEVTDALLDKGEVLPTLYEWLQEKNEFFGGEPRLEDMHMVLDDDDPSTLDSVVRVEEGAIPTDYSKVVYRGGPTYKNRPILWIVNNTYCTITNYTKSTLTIRTKNNDSGATTMPDFIDEVKSVYVSEDDNVYYSFIDADELPALHPVTVFVYTHPQFFNKKKGLRRTYFHGYDVPTEFEMEDYTDLPPMEDFRRTLYWAPTVRTDASGKAQVEFFNNSSCRQMYLSVEGVTPEGRFLVNE